MASHYHQSHILAPHATIDVQSISILLDIHVDHNVEVDDKPRVVAEGLVAFCLELYIFKLVQIHLSLQEIQKLAELVLVYFE